MPHQLCDKIIQRFENLLGEKNLPKSSDNNLNHLGISDNQREFCDSLVATVDTYILHLHRFSTKKHLHEVYRIPPKSYMPSQGPREKYTYIFFKRRYFGAKNYCVCKIGLRKANT